MKRALVLANIFNLLIGIYFIIISIVSLVHLRWYHQLTIAIRVRHIITSATSYSSFIILLFEAVILILIFILSGSFLTESKKYIRGNVQDKNAINLKTITHSNDNNNQTTFNTEIHYNVPDRQQTLTKQRISSDHHHDQSTTGNSSQQQQHITFNQQTSLSEHTKNSNICCSIFLHLISSICLIVILVIWLLNTGELVRDSISTQLDSAFLRYQFANRSNPYSVAIDGMQDINNCCGSLDYTDFPHQRISGLSSGHYPGSCCGKHIFGVNARVLCVPEEIIRARQTAGCVTVLSNFYDLISILIVPAALVCLFVSVTIIALSTISNNYNLSMQEFPILDKSPTNTKYGY